MLRSLEKKMIGFLDFFYFFIFKKRVGETKIVFFKDIFVSALGNGLAGIFLFGTSILMGRMLGPAEYGKAGLAVSYGYLFLFLMAPGFNTAAVRYIANEGDEKEKGRIMTVVLTSTLASLVPVCVLFFFFYRPLSVFLQVDPLILFFGFVYAIPLALKNVFDGFTRGFRRFTLQLVARVGEAIVVFSVITFSLFFFHIRSFFVYSISLSIGLAVFCLLVFFPFFSSFGRFSFRILKKIIFYSFFAALGGVAGFLFLNINRIIVSYAVGASSVGLYMAYYTATFTFASQFLTIFNNVFFPMVSRMPKKRDIVRKINTLNKVLAVPLFGGIVAFGYFFLYLFGKEYLFRWDWLLLFSLAAILNLFYLIDIWIVAAEGKKGIVFTTAITFCIGAINVACMYAFSTWYGVTGSVIATVLVSFVLFLVYKIVNIFLYRYEDTQSN